MATSGHEVRQAGAMTLRCVAAADIAAQAWRNGGGRTRELLAWPAPDDWTMRVSVAGIDTDGPFSAFPGVERWFAVVEGAGVMLAFGGVERRVVAGDAPLRFDAAPAPRCRLIDGPTVDLNLMLRGGRGVMQPAKSGVAWEAASAVRALFAAVAGLWQGPGETMRVAPRTLAWTDAAPDALGAWTFVADVPGPTVAGWWLGYSPDRAPA
jgi:environmental stress-induced protein Ves